ncbi:hypothetical protein CWM41_28500, partial [Escherichia coli]|uniref:hypothetical protein n=1 Tax=Escherichia coli TaxID=562 RepID=UPI000CC1712C
AALCQLFDNVPCSLTLSASKSAEHNHLTHGVVTMFTSQCKQIRDSVRAISAQKDSNVHQRRVGAIPAKMGAVEHD